MFIFIIFERIYDFLSVNSWKQFCYVKVIAKKHKILEFENENL